MNGDTAQPAVSVIDNFDAFLFDLDGVITPTVLLHRRAWQEMFDRFFASIGADPYSDDDYFTSLDGKPRYEGVKALLTARGITLDLGTPDDTGHGTPTVKGLGNLKNETFTRLLERDGIDPYPGSLRLIEQLTDQGAPLAIVSSSRNAEAVLRAARVRDFFEVVVDGITAAREHLAGKPAPDMFLHAAARLGVTPERCAVLEDAISGVHAASAGNFGLVVGVDRGTGSQALIDAGAHVIVEDLEELLR